MKMPIGPISLLVLLMTIFSLQLLILKQINTLRTLFAGILVFCLDSTSFLFDLVFIFKSLLENEVGNKVVS